MTDEDLLTAAWNVDEGLELRRQDLQASHLRAGASGETRELLRQYLNAALAGGVDRSQVTDPTQRGDLGAGLLDSLGLAVTDPVLADDIRAQLDAFAAQRSIASNDPTQLAVHQTRGRVDLGTGQFSHEATDLVVRGAGIDFVFRRSYRQQAAYFGPLGACWDHPYNLWLRQVGDNLVRSMRSVREDSFIRHPKFGQTGFSYWVPPDGQLGIIVEAAASFVWQGPGGQRVVYEEDPGRPLVHRATRLEDRFGNYLGLSYDQDRLAQVAVNHPDRRVTFAYDTEDRITAISDYTGRRCGYDYDDHGDLVRVTRPPTGRYPAGLATSYEYSTGSSSPPLAHNLLRIIDAAGQVVLENSYGENTGGLDFNRVVAQRQGAGETLFEYETVVSEFEHDYTDSERPASQVNYTGRNGHPIHYVHNKFGNLLLREEYVLGGGRGRLLQWRHRYNRDGQLIATLTPEGSLTQHLYGRDQYRRVHQITDAEVAEHSALTFTERMAFGNLLATVRRGKRFSLASMDLSLGVWGDILPDVVSAVDVDDVVVKRAYEPDFQQIVTSSDPRFTERADPQHPEPPSYTATLTRYEYSGPRGQPNLLLARVRYPSCTLPDGSVVPGASDQFTSYDGHGRLLQAVDRAGSVTEATYYQPADGVKEGYLKTHELDVGGLAVRTEQEVDQRGLTTAIHNPRSVGASGGRFVTQIGINELDQLEQVQASPPFSFVARALYDRSGLLERIERDLKDEQGAPALGGIEVQRRIYDSEGNLTRHSLGGRDLAGELVTRHRYDEAGLRRATTTPAGRTITRAYDERMLEATVTRGAGSSESSTRRSQYDGDGRKVADRSGRGKVTRYSYDPLGRLVLIEDALGNRTRRDYDKAGNLLVERFFERRGDGSFDLLTRRECAYDELNRRVREGHNLFPAPIPVADTELAHRSSPGPGSLLVTEYYHDVKGRPERAVDPQGRASRTEWDALDRVSASIDALDNRTETHYDAAGNLVRMDVRETVRDPATGVVTGEEVFSATSTYDELDRRTSQTDSLGNTTRFGYDSRGQLTRVTDALGNIHRTSYDVYGRKVTELSELTESGLGGGGALPPIVTKFEYDPDGNLRAQIDANGNRTRQDFDALARRRAVTYADASEEFYSYDRDDNLIAVQDANGVLRTIVPDPIGRPSRIDVDRSRLPVGLAVEGETFEEYVYDGQDRRLLEKNDFARIESKVDSLGRPYEETTTYLSPVAPGLSALSLARTYTPAGAVERLKYPDGRVLRYDRDDLDRLIRLENVTNGTAYPGSSVLGDEYDVLQLAYRGRRRLKFQSGNGNASVFSHDGAGRVIEISHRTASGVSLLIHQQLYDAIGNARLRNDLEAGLPANGERVQYDSSYRMTNVEETPTIPAFLPASLAPMTAPSLDPIPHGQAAIDALIGSLLQHSTDPTFAYDLAGNRILEQRSGQSPLAYNINSLNQYISVDGTILAYDLAGNLRSDGKLAYVFDSRNLLVRVHDSATGGNLAQFFHDARGRRIAELKGAVVTHFLWDDANVVEERRTGNLFAQYVHEGALDLTCQIAHSGREYWYHRDAMGSTRLLTDTAGVVAGQYRYDPFGVLQLSIGPYNPVRYVGCRFDSDLSMYDMRARTYSPKQGRFIQREPRGGAPGANAYSYANNNPLTFYDTLGTEPEVLPAGTSTGLVGSVGTPGQGISLSASNTNDETYPWWNRIAVRASNVKRGYLDYEADLDRRQKDWDIAAERLVAEHDRLSFKEAFNQFLNHKVEGLSAIFYSPDEAYVIDRIGDRPQHFLYDISEAWAAFLAVKFPGPAAIQGPLPVALGRLALETGAEVPSYAVPAGRDWRYTSGPLPKLYSVGNESKVRSGVNWGGFQEENLAQYIHGNQWDPEFAGAVRDKPVGIYEYYVEPPPGTPAGISKVAKQPTVDFAAEPKIQYFNPGGLGVPKRGRLVGIRKPGP